MWLSYWIFCYNQRERNVFSQILRELWLFLFLFWVKSASIVMPTLLSEFLFIHGAKYLRAFCWRIPMENFSLFYAFVCHSVRRFRFLFFNPEMMLFLKKHIRMLMTRTGLRIRLHIIKGRKKNGVTCQNKAAIFHFLVLFKQIPATSQIISPCDSIQILRLFRKNYFNIDHRGKHMCVTVYTSKWKEQQRKTN